MPRTEIVSMRDACSKHFLRDDGQIDVLGTFHAQHYHDGASWKDIDNYLYSEPFTDSDGDTYTHGTHAHPHKIRIDKLKKAMRIDFAGAEVKIKPIGCNNIDGVKSLNTITYQNAWDGIDLKRIVTPEGVLEELHITSTLGQRVVEWSVKGSMEKFRTPVVESIDMQVPWSFDGDTLSFDLTAVPVGSVVF